MNTKAKIAAGVVTGLIAGASVMGAAFAAPKALVNAAPAVYRTAGPAVGTAAGEAPTIAAMRSFMDAYRTPSGSIDMNRMHADVTSGKVTPPCANRTSSGRGTSSAPSGQSTQRGGYGMMDGTF